MGARGADRSRGHAERVSAPRSDGRILVGTTLEEAGFDKRTDADTIQRMYQAAANLIPSLGEARMLEAWAGLRPGTPDNLPILGATSLPGYFVATGHFRDGILLSAVTAKVMGEVVRGSIHYHALFMVGLVLFMITLAINYAAQKIVQRYRMSIG